VTQLLDLSALERDTVKLADSTIVELRNPDELSVVDDYKFRKLIVELSGLDPSTITTEEQADEGSKKLHDAAALIAVSLPEGVDDATCAALFTAWMEKHVVAREVESPPRKGRRTSAASSRGSKRSTAATPRRGSQKSRGTS
jgi:hypothetical protein